MNRHHRYRPSPAMVVACISLVVAMGGTSYAALTITGKNVKNSSLTGKDVKNSSLTTSDVKNRSLLAADFKSGQLPQGGGAQGPQGPQGNTGPQGSTGPQGPAGPFPEGNLPAGKTLRGTYGLSAVNSWTHAHGTHSHSCSSAFGCTVGSSAVPSATQGSENGFTGISYVFQLASAPAVHVIAVGGATPAGCQGNANAPGADPGHLCIFQTVDSGGSVVITQNTRFGAVLALVADTPSSGDAARNEGRWAVTSS